MPRRTLPYDNKMLCQATPCHTTPCHTTPGHAVPCQTIPYTKPTHETSHRLADKTGPSMQACAQHTRSLHSFSILPTMYNDNVTKPLTTPLSARHTNSNNRFRCSCTWLTLILAAAASAGCSFLFNPCATTSSASDLDGPSIAVWRCCLCARERVRERERE
jgi:hypothetical protein